MKIIRVTSPKGFLRHVGGRLKLEGVADPEGVVSQLLDSQRENTFAVCVVEEEKVVAFLVGWSNPMEGFVSLLQVDPLDSPHVGVLVGMLKEWTENVGKGMVRVVFPVEEGWPQSVGFTPTHTIYQLDVKDQEDEVMVDTDATEEGLNPTSTKE